MENDYHGLILQNRIYPMDELPSFCTKKLKDPAVPEWEKRIFQFVMEWLDDKDYIIQHSSGTSGTPKELHLSKKSMTLSALKTFRLFDLSFGQTILLCLPADYIAGKMTIVRAMAGGLNLIFTEPTSMPNISGLGRIDFCSMVPLQAYNSLNSFEALRNIKKLIIGGSEMRPELDVLLRDLPQEIYATYGMAETCSHVAVRRISGKQYEKYFSAIPGVEFSVDNRNCLVIKADYLDHTIITNDVVDLIDEYTFRWIGRFDNLINSAGIKIIPEEIESVVSKATGMDCAIIGLPDKKLGQKIVLVIEKGGSDMSPAELTSTIKKELPKHLQPKEIIFIDRIPRNRSYKVDRNKLMKQLK